MLNFHTSHARNGLKNENKNSPPSDVEDLVKQKIKTS